MTITRACPGCHKHALQPVAGGLGKMGQCPGCGWTGAMRREDEPPKARTKWPGVRCVPVSDLVDDGVDILAEIVANEAMGKRERN